MWNETPEYSAQIAYSSVTAEPSIGNIVLLVFKKNNKKKKK